MSTTIEEKRQTFGEMRSLVEEIIDETTLDHVKQGMTLLKIKYGENYVEHIDPKTLDLACGSDCVLGQLYGSYDEGLAALNIGNGGDYGFDANGASYHELDAAWIQLLHEELLAR